MPQSNFPNSMCKRHGTLTLKCKTKSLHFKVRMDSLPFAFLSITLCKETDRTNTDFGRSAKIASCQLSDEGSGPGLHVNEGWRAVVPRRQIRLHILQPSPARPHHPMTACTACRRQRGHSFGTNLCAPCSTLLHNSHIASLQQTKRSGKMCVSKINQGCYCYT